MTPGKRADTDKRAEMPKCEPGGSGTRRSLEMGNDDRTNEKAKGDD